MAGGGFSISILNDNLNKKFLLALLNSNLLFWYLNKLSNLFRGGWITCTKQYFSQLPIKTIDINNKTSKYLHDEVIKLVDQLLKLNNEKAETKLQTSVSQLESKVDYCENRINEIVYQLYELTEDEIKIVEGRYV